MFFISLVGAVAACVTAVFGQDSAGACTAINEDLARLACYDRALGRSPTPDPTPATHWRVRSTKSDFTDQTDVYISTVAEGPLQCSYAEGVFYNCDYAGQSSTHTRYDNDAFFANPEFELFLPLREEMTLSSEALFVHRITCEGGGKTQPSGA